MDPENVSAAQQGDALALDRLLDELGPYVRRLCARIAPAAADDATQEALLAVFRGLPSLRAPEAIMTWVRSVTVRTATRLARQHDLEVAAEGTPLDRYASSLEGLVDIDDALARLPVSQRVVLVLRTREGLSEQEIATTLGIPKGTVPPAGWAARPCWRILNTGARTPRCPAEAGHTTAAPPSRKSTRSSTQSKGSLPTMGAEFRGISPDV
jgi:RNA polymerase sigma-70 factor (ECF subfamily)